MTEKLAGSKTVLLALQLAIISDEDSISTVHNVLKSTSLSRNGVSVSELGEALNSRSWVKKALDALKTEGLLSFTSVDDLEQEAVTKAMSASSIGLRRLEISGYTERSMNAK